MTEAGLATRIQQMIAEREALGELWGEARAEVRGAPTCFCTRCGGASGRCRRMRRPGSAVLQSRW